MGVTTDERPVAVIGAGAIGLSLASAMARAGRSVLVCGRTPIDRIEITEERTTESWPVRHTTTPTDLVGVDTAILAVKAHQTADVADWLHVLARPGVTVLLAQNGIEQRERVTPFTGDAHTVPAVLYLNVERTAPGRAILRRVGDHDLALPDDDAARSLASDLVTGHMRVAFEHDFDVAAWTKLLANITANPLTALTGRRVEVLREPSIARLARQIMDEAAAAARADGVALTADQVDETLGWLQDAPPGATTSMLQDRLAGRPLEYDALTGAVVRAAERHGVEVPVNRLVLALLAAIGPESHE